MLRYILAGLAAFVLITASLIPDAADARAGYRGGGGGYRGGAVAVRGPRGGGAVAVRGGGYGYRGYGYRPGYGAAAVGAAAVGAAALGAAAYSRRGCGYDAYGNWVCPGGYYGY